MDLSDSPEEAAFRAEARAFLQGQDPPSMAEYSDDTVDEEDYLARSRAWQRTLADGGWAALMWPEAYGGRGLGPIQQIVWNQELARVGAGESLFVAGVGMAGPTLIAHGTEEQRERYLAPILRADEIWCQLFSEPGAGSDLAGLATRAERDGDDWVVSGQKTWCSGGHYSDFGMLLARTDSSVPKHKGITFFICDMKAPGIEIRPLEQWNRGKHFNEVFLNDVRIPDASRVDAVGNGWRVAQTTLMNERMSMGGFDAFFSFDDLVAEAKRNPARVNDVVRDSMGWVYTWLKATELLNASTMTQLARGRMAVSETAMMKVAMARLLTRAGELGLELEGPAGMLRRGNWQNHFMMAPAFHIAGGTDEVQRNVCAERVLGLPAEARTDRDVPFDELPRS